MALQRGHVVRLEAVKRGPCGPCGPQRSLRSGLGFTYHRVGGLKYQTATTQNTRRMMCKPLRELRAWRSPVRHAVARLEALKRGPCGPQRSSRSGYPRYDEISRSCREYFKPPTRCCVNICRCASCALGGLLPGASSNSRPSSKPPGGPQRIYRSYDRISECRRVVFQNTARGPSTSAALDAFEPYARAQITQL